MRKNWGHRLDRNRLDRRPAPPPRPSRRDDEIEGSRRREDTGRYSNGYRIYRDGSYREDFGADR